MLNPLPQCPHPLGARVAKVAAATLDFFEGQLTKFSISLVVYLIGAISICQAQASCDSLYSAEDKFREGKIGLILFDAPPKVVFGVEKLNNYTNSKDKTGMVTYRVAINEVGNASCLTFAGTSNKLLVDEANAIAQSLKFAPALLRGKGIKSTMFVTVRFHEEKSRKHRGGNF